MTGILQFIFEFLKFWQFSHFTKLFLSIGRLTGGSWENSISMGDLIEIPPDRRNAQLNREGIKKPADRDLIIQAIEVYSA